MKNLKSCTKSSADLTCPNLENLFCSENKFSFSKVYNSNKSWTVKSKEEYLRLRFEDQVQQKYIYNPVGDGACLFRSYLAYHKKDPAWLRQKSLAEIYSWINENKQIFIDAIGKTVKSMVSFESKDDALLTSEQDEKLVNGIENDLVIDLLNNMMEQDQFALWKIENVKLFLNHYLDCEFSDEAVEQFIDLIFQGLVEDLDIPIDQNSDIFIQHKSYHHVLVSKIPLFNLPQVQKNSKSSKADEKQLKFNLDCTENAYKPINDGTSFLRAFLAVTQNNTSWLAKKSLTEFYLWIEQNKNTFKEAIKDALDELHLNDYFNESNLFTSSTFLYQMQTNTSFDLFTPEHVYHFVNQHNLKISWGNIENFISSIKSKLMQSFSIKQARNDSLFIKDNISLVPLENDAYLVVARDHLLEGDPPLLSNEVSVSPYIQLNYRQDLTEFYLPFFSSSETLYRNYLALIDGTEYGFTADSLSLTRGLYHKKLFRKAFILSIKKAIAALSHTKSLDPKSMKKLVNQFIKRFFKQGNCHLNENLKLITQKYSWFRGFLNEQDLQAIEVKMHGFQKSVEKEILHQLGYSLVTEGELQKFHTNGEFFILNKNDRYSFVALKNYFEPCYEPVDKEIYHADLTENPDRDKVSHLFDKHYGQQILEKLGNYISAVPSFEQEQANNAKENTDNFFDSSAQWEKAGGYWLEQNEALEDENEDWLDDPVSIWSQAIEAETQMYEKPIGKPLVNLAQTGRRDGLFRSVDAINAAANLVSNFLEKANDVAQNLGFNTHPYVPRQQEIRERQKIASAIASTKSEPQDANSNNELIEKSIVNNEDEKASSSIANFVTQMEKMLAKDQAARNTDVTFWDPLRFPETEAAPVWLTGNAIDEEVREEYDAWHQNSVEEHAANKRVKRRIVGQLLKLISPQQLIDLEFYQIDPRVQPDELTRIQTYLATDSDKIAAYVPNSDLFNQKFTHDLDLGRVETIFEELMNSAAKNPILEMHYLDLLDLIHRIAIENNPEFGESFRFYLLNNEISLKESKSFYFHKKAENFITKVTGSNDAFQKMAKTTDELKKKQLRLLAEILHKRSSSQPIDFEQLAMLFAHLDINKVGLGGGIRIDNWSYFLENWMSKLSSKKAKNLHKALLRKLNKKNLSGNFASPMRLNQGALFDRATSTSSDNTGFCSYYSSSVLIAMKNNDLDGLLSVIEMQDCLNQFSVGDPIETYRSLNALNELNTDIQLQKFDDPKHPGQKITETSLFKSHPDFASLLEQIYASKYGFKIKIHASGSRHAVAIGKIKINGEYLPVLHDANVGTAICYSKEQLVEALTTTFHHMKWYNQNDPTFSSIEFKSLEMTPEHLKITENLSTSDGRKYGQLSESALRKLAKSHHIASARQWENIFPGLNKAKGDPHSAEIYTKYKQRTQIAAGEIDTLIAEAMDKDTSTSIDKFATEPVNLAAALEKAEIATKVTLDIESTFRFGTAKNSIFNKLKTIIAASMSSTDIADLQIKLYEVAGEINRLRAFDDRSRKFLEEMLETYLKKIFETDKGAREAFSYFLQRTKEEVWQNSRVYTDADLAAFYYCDLDVAYNKPLTGLNHRIDLLLGKILLAQHQGISLDPKLLGLAWGEISMYRQVYNQLETGAYVRQAVANHQQSMQNPDNAKLANTFNEFCLEDTEVDAKINSDPDLSAWLNARDTDLTEEQINYKTELRRHTAPVYEPVDLGINKLLSDGSPVTGYGQGIHRFIALSPAIFLASNTQEINTDKCQQVLKMLDSLRNYAADEPLLANRLVNGIKKADNQLLATIEHQLFSKGQEVNLYDITQKLEQASDPIVLTLTNAAGSDPHVISISPVFTKDLDDSPKMFKHYLLVDGRLDLAVPCASPEAAVDMLKLSMNRYGGYEVDNENFVAVKLSAFELNQEAQALIHSVESRTHNQKATSVNEGFSFTRVFEESSWKGLIETDSVSKIHLESWRAVLPEELTSSKITYDTNDGLKVVAKQQTNVFGRSDATNYLTHLEILAHQNEIECATGSCSADLKKYRRVDLDENTQNDLVFAEFDQETSRDLEGGSLHAQERDYVSVNDIGETEHNIKAFGTPSVISLTAPDLDATHFEAPKANVQPSTKTQQLLEGVSKLKEISDVKQSSDFVVTTEPTRNLLADAVAFDKVALERQKSFHTQSDSKNQPPVKPKKAGGAAKKRPKRPTQPPPPIPSEKFNADKTQMQQRIEKAADALTAAAVADNNVDSTLLHSSAEKTKIQRQEKAKNKKGAKIKTETLADGTKQVSIASLQFSLGVENKAQQINIITEAIKQRLALNKIDGSRGADVVQAKLPESKDDAKAELDLSEKIELAEGESVKAEEVKTVFKHITEKQDSVLMRQILRDVEEVQLEMHVQKALRVEMRDELDRFLSSQNMDTEDWDILPPKEGSDEFCFVYKGGAELDDPSEMVKTLKIPENIQQRLESSKQKIQKFTCVQEQRISKRLAVEADFFLKPSMQDNPIRSSAPLSSQQVAMTGLNVVSKAMVLLNGLEMIFDPADIENMNLVEQISTSINNVDTAIDIFSNTLSATNKIVKVIQQGVNNPAVRIASKAAGSFSTGLGLFAGTATTVSSIHSLATAKSQYEVDVAVTELVFASVSLALNIVALAFPVAAPVIAVIGFINMGLQMLIMHLLSEKESWRRAQESIDERFKETEDLLKVIFAIANSEIKSAQVTQSEEGTTIVLQNQAESQRIIITDKSITIRQGVNAFSVSLLENGSYELVKKKDGEIKQVIVYEFCKQGDHEEECTLNVSNPQHRAMLIKTGFQATGGEIKVKKRQPLIDLPPESQHVVDMNIFKAKKLTTKAHHNNAVIPCLLLSENSPEQMKEKLHHFMEKIIPYNSTGRVKSIMVNEVYPRVNLRSDTTHWLENKYEAGVQPNHPHVQAIRGDVCKPKYISPNYKQVMQSVYQSARETEPNYTEQSAPVEQLPDFDWDTKAYVYLAPPIRNKDDTWSTNKPFLLQGESYFLLDSQRAEQKIYDAKVEYVLGNLPQARAKGLSGPISGKASTVLDSVILEQQDVQEYDINMQKTPVVQLVLMPEKHATNSLTKLDEFFVIENKKEGEEGKSFSLPIHPESYKNINKLPIYRFNLYANQHANLAVGLGSRTYIFEKDNQDGKRVGEYYLSTISTFSKEEQIQSILSLSRQIEKIQADITELRDILNKNVYRNPDLDAEVKWISIAGEEREKFVAKLAAFEEKKKEMERVKSAIQNRPVADAKHLKTKISISKNNDGKTELSIIFNPVTVISEKNRLSQGELVISDLQRNLTLVQSEAINAIRYEYGQQVTIEVPINLVFTIVLNKDPATAATKPFIFSFSHIQGISNLVFRDLRMLGFKKLWQRLVMNNPQLESKMPKNWVIRDMNFENRVEDYIAGATHFYNHNEARFELTPVENPALYTGYITIFEADQDVPRYINTFYKKDSPSELVEIYEGLQFIGTEQVTNPSDIPVEYQYDYQECLTLHTEPLIYFFYNPKTKTLARQYFNRVIKPQYLTQCSAKELPARVSAFGTWIASDFYYRCVSPEQMDLAVEIEDYKKQQRNGFFNYLTQVQQNENLKEIVLANAGYSQGQGQIHSLLMKFFSAGKPLILFIPSSLQLPELIRNIENGYVVFANKIGSSEPSVQARLEKTNAIRKVNGLSALHELEVAVQLLVQDEKLVELEKYLLEDGNEKKPIPNIFVNKPLILSSDLHIIWISENKDGLVFGTYDGIIFSVSKDGKTRHLLGVDSAFFLEKGINPKDTTRVIEAYQELVARFGKPKTAYLRIFGGNSLIHSESIATRSKRDLEAGNFVVLFDVLTHQLLYVPRSEKISENIVILGSLRTKNVIEITVLDPKHRTITAVNHPSAFETAKLASQIDFIYYSPTQSGGAILLLKANEDSKEVELPYMPVSDLHFLAQRANSQHGFSRIKIPEMQREQIGMITLMPEETGAQGYQRVQQIGLDTDAGQQATAFIRNHVRLQINNENPAAVTTREVVIEELLIAVPKKAFRTDGRGNSLYFRKDNVDGIERTHTLIKLHDPFDENGSVKACFADSIFINAKPLSLQDLQQLIANAKDIPDPDNPTLIGLAKSKAMAKAED